MNTRFMRVPGIQNLYLDLERRRASTGLLGPEQDHGPLIDRLIVNH